MKKVFFWCLAAFVAGSLSSCDPAKQPTTPEQKEPEKPVVDNSVKAAYADFLGNWIVTGTEQKFFGIWHDRTELYTFSYAIQIKMNVDGESYLIENWETGATEKDRQYLYYGSTVDMSLYDYYMTQVGKYIGLLARYDATTGTLQIDRQTFFTSVEGGYTVEFLGSTQVGDERSYPRGSFAANLSETSFEYTICDFVMQKDGSVVIKAHPQTESGLENLAFMGYCQYFGWYPNPKYYNSQFAFPYSMKKQ